MTKGQAKILITGVAGFIGRHTARHFARLGWHVYGVDAATAENTPLHHLERYESMRMPSPKLSDLVKEWQPEVLIHCAGRASVDHSLTHPDADFYGNTVTAFETLETLRRNCPTCRFINLSSAAVYGNPSSLPVSESLMPAPISPYGFHKWQTDLLCMEYAKVYSMQTASLRIFSAYGSGLRRQVMWDICHKAITLGSVPLHGNGEESRDFVHVQDITRALETLATAKILSGQTYNLGSGREVTIRQLATMVLAQLDLDIGPVFSNELGDGIPRNWCADLSRLKSLGYEPIVTLEQGVSQFVTWCRAELEGI